MIWLKFNVFKENLLHISIGIQYFWGDVIQIDNTLISDDLVSTHFVCDLNACKGDCCVQGDAGAPVEQNEVKEIKRVFEVIKPLLSKKSQDEIHKQGQVVYNASEKEYQTPIINGKECVYLTKDEKGIGVCAFQLAYQNKTSGFVKPISCHLYPVRIKEHQKFTAVNYHQWDICKAAILCGKKLKMPLFKFLKLPLIRKFGAEWYKALDYYYERKLKS